MLAHAGDYLLASIYLAALAAVITKIIAKIWFHQKSQFIQSLRAFSTEGE